MDSPAFVAAPYLQAGDNLTRDKFLRIWNTLPKLKRAELIRGVVYTPRGRKWHIQAAHAAQRSKRWCATAYFAALRARLGKMRQT
jgi:hypothetical protein